MDTPLYQLAEKIVEVGNGIKELDKMLTVVGANNPMVRIYSTSSSLYIYLTSLHQLKNEVQEAFKNTVVKDTKDLFEGWGNFQKAHHSLAKQEIQRIQENDVAKVCLNLFLGIGYFLINPGLLTTQKRIQKILSTRYPRIMSIFVRCEPDMATSCTIFMELLKRFESKEAYARIYNFMGADLARQEEDLKRWKKNKEKAKAPENTSQS